MRRIVFVLFVGVALAGVVAYMAPASGQADGEAASIFGVKIPPGYRDWRLISVAHEEGNLNDIRAILGNDKAINTYREGKLSFPVPPRIGTFSLWSRTRKNTPRRAAGASLNLIRTANPPTRLCSTLALPATRPSKSATSSSPVTRPNESTHSAEGPGARSNI